MTITDNGRDSAATSAATDLSDADKAVLARADWHESGGTLTGKQLAERYGRSARWGQKQRAAAEREAAERDGAPVPRPVPSATVPVPRPREKRTTTAPPITTRDTPLALRACRDLGCIVVIAVCAVLSYTHIRDLALQVGMDNATWVPLGIDGLMAVTTCSLMIDKRAGRRPLRAAQIGLALGIIGTLVANALASAPEWSLPGVVRVGLAVYPPATLAVVLHLVFLRTAGDR